LHEQGTIFDRINGSTVGNKQLKKCRRQNDEQQVGRKATNQIADQKPKKEEGTQQ